MTVSYHQMADWVEEIAAQFPDEFFENLSGGIQVEERALPDPNFPPGAMYTMGQYCCTNLGRHIVLYYGSFTALMNGQSEDAWKKEIFRIIAHEFTHHLEGAAMIRDLEVKDEEFMEKMRHHYQKD